MNMKPAAAFAAGLWIGAVVVVAIGAFNLRIWEGVRREGEPRAAAEQTAKDNEIQHLRQEQARLTAEAQRLRETVAELKSNLDVRTALAARREVRRVPFFRPSPADESKNAWIAEAVARGDTQSLPRLEELSNQNDEAALEALALMAERDGGAALTRVWGSASLSFANKVKATRYLAATLEANPRAQELLQSLFNSPTTDVRLLYAAVDGIANPDVVATLSPVVGLPPPPQPRVAFDLRVQLLDTLMVSITDQRLLDHAEHARDELLTHWVQTEPGAQ
jgi:hypothetical protein